jgi:hypothetical protein
MLASTRPPSQFVHEIESYWILIKPLNRSTDWALKVIDRLRLRARALWLKREICSLFVVSDTFFAQHGLNALVVLHRRAHEDIVAPARTQSYLVECRG